MCDGTDVTNKNEFSLARLEKEVETALLELFPFFVGMSSEIRGTQALSCHRDHWRP